MPAVEIRGDKPGSQRVYTRTVQDLLGVPDGGASPTGSTYYKTLLGCPREFGLRYDAGIDVARKSSALTLGWSWHYVLEMYYRAQMAGGAGKALGTASAFGVIEVLEADPEYREMGGKLRAMFDRYLDMYDAEDNWRVLAVEETLVYNGPFDYSARLDVVVEDLQRGGLWIVEHKSARALSTELLDNYQMDMQILGQIWLVHHCVNLAKYPHYMGVRVNVITTGTKLPQCARVDVLPSEGHLAAFERAMRRWSPLRLTMKALEYPQALGHCSGYARGYSRCDFFGLCHDWPGLGVDHWRQVPDDEIPEGYVRPKKEPEAA